MGPSISQHSPASIKNPPRETAQMLLPATRGCRMTRSGIRFARLSDGLNKKRGKIEDGPPPACIVSFSLSKPAENHAKRISKRVILQPRVAGSNIWAISRGGFLMEAELWGPVLVSIGLPSVSLQAARYNTGSERVPDDGTQGEKPIQLPPKPRVPTNQKK